MRIEGAVKFETIESAGEKIWVNTVRQQWTYYKYVLSTLPVYLQ